MSTHPASTTAQPSGFKLTPGDIIYTLFRHLKKIIFFAIVGVVAGIGIYKMWPTYFQSDASIVVRFVTEDRVLDGEARTSVVTPGGRNSSYILANEMAIIKSLDLAKIVADEVGPARVVDNPENPNPSTLAAAGVILSGLNVNNARGGNMLTISVQHKNPEVAKAIMDQIIESYPRRHLELHRKSSAFEEYVTRETDQMRMRLQQTEDEIRNALNKANIISVADAKATISTQRSRTQQQLFELKTQLAELNFKITSQEEARAAYAKRNPEAAAEEQEEAAQLAEEAAAADGPSIAVMRQYSDLREKFEILREKEKSLSLRYTPENSLYQNARQQVMAVDKQLQELTQQYPELANTPRMVTTSDGQQQAAPGTDQLTADKFTAMTLQTRYKILQDLLAELSAEAAKIEQVELVVNELSRRKALQDSKYRSLLESMEKTRVQDDLGDGRVNNISILQSPSPARRAADPQREKLSLAIGGGLDAVGLAWAFLVDLLLDRSIKRPTEIQRNLGIPLFMSLPDLNDKRYKRIGAKADRALLQQAGRVKQLNAAKDKTAYKPKSPTLQAAALTKPEEYGNGATEVKMIAPWEDQHALNEHFEALRDKVITYFESKNLTHKPKLIAMTGLGKKSGVTTIASGLAGSLSKIGEGNVLLVDMTLGHETAQQFYKGKNILNLDEVLDSNETSGGAKMDNNLYVVAEGTNGTKLPRIMPQRFNAIIPKLKASDFDYIIFDMPPVSPISSTPRLASFMDVVLMVMESEETNRDTALQALELLSDSKAHLGGILNKTKSHVPKKLEQDLLSQA